jgi:hypothetical protein
MHIVDGVVLGIAVGVLLWKVSIIHSVGGVVLLIAVDFLLCILITGA